MEEMDTKEIFRRMHAGEIYYENSETGKDQGKYRDILYDFNHTRPSNREQKDRLLKELLGSMGEGVYIEQPLSANWGKNSHFGNRVYANSNLTLVDDTRIDIGDHTMIGPNVTIATGTHPLEPELRKNGAQYNLPVVIGRNVWLGAGAIVLPGVTIGDNSVIGAGSLVTKDIPANVLAFGSPCRVIREIDCD